MIFYDINKHIEACIDKGETFSADTLGEIANSKAFKFHSLTMRIKFLKLLEIEWVQYRESYEKFSVEYMNMWSKLTVLDNVIQLLNKDLEELLNNE